MLMPWHQEVAMKILSPTALAYYCSGADDELSEHSFAMVPFASGCRG